MRTFKVGRWAKPHGDGLEWNVDSEDEHGTRAVIAECPTEELARFIVDACNAAERAKRMEAFLTRTHEEFEASMTPVGRVLTDFILGPAERADAAVDLFSDPERLRTMDANLSNPEPFSAFHRKNH